MPVRNSYLEDRGPAHAKAIDFVLNRLCDLETIGKVLPGGVGRGIAGAVAVAFTTPVSVAAIIAAWLGGPLAEYVTRSEIEDDIRTIREGLTGTVKQVGEVQSLTQRIAATLSRARSGRLDVLQRAALRFAGYFRDDLTRQIEKAQATLEGPMSEALDDLGAAVNRLHPQVVALRDKVVELQRQRDRDKRSLQACKNELRQLGKPTIGPGRR